MTPRLLRSLLPIPVLAFALGVAGPEDDGCRLTTAGVVAPLIVAAGDTVDIQLALTAACPAGEGARSDILLLLDRSSSMGDDGKLDAAKGAVREFVGRVDFSRHRVGLVGFTSSAFVLQPLTNRPDRVLSALEAAGGPSRGTDIAEAIRLADEEFEATSRAGAVAVMLLLTDGRSNTEAMVQAAGDARAKGTVIFAVALGPDADRDALLLVAGSEAHLAYAAGPDELAAIYERIAGIIQSFKVTDVRVYAELEERATYVAGSGRPTPAGKGTLGWWLPILTAEPTTMTLRAQMTRPGLYPPVTAARAEFVDGSGARRGVPFPPFPAVEVLPPVLRSIFLPALARGACLTPAPGADVVLAVDTSDSMRGGKLDEAVAGAQAFLDLLDPAVDQAAVVGYDAQAAATVDLTSDLRAVAAALTGLRTGHGTRIDRGIEAAAAVAVGRGHRPASASVIVLLSDGRQVESPGTAVAAGGLAGRAGIVIFTVALGSDADQALLRGVAGDDARAYVAPTSANLAGIYTAIAGTVRCRGRSGAGD